MNTEVSSDLLEGHTRVAFAGHPHNIVTELLRIGLGHLDILSGQLFERATLDVTATRGRPVTWPCWSTAR